MVVVGLQQIAACCVGGEIEMRCVVSWERWGGREHITRVAVAGGRRSGRPRPGPLLAGGTPRRSLAEGAACAHAGGRRSPGNAAANAVAGDTAAGALAGGRRHACPRRRPPKPRRSIACAPPSPEEDAEIERG